MKQRMVTILRPSFNPHPNGIRGDRVTPRIHDYVDVPWIQTIGTWRTQDIMCAENVAKLAVFANGLENKSGKRRKSFT